MNTPRQPNARPTIAQLNDWISGRTLNPLRLSDAARKRMSKPSAASGGGHVSRVSVARLLRTLAHRCPAAVAFTLRQEYTT
jgi:hypothetical protein